MSDCPPAEGAVHFPQRAPFWAVAGFIASVLGATFTGGVYKTSIDNRIEGLIEADTRSLRRSDERYQLVRDRLDSLERGRSDGETRLIRLEEQMRHATDLLREIREALRQPPASRR